jgi:hypothetical protein
VLDEVAGVWLTLAVVVGATSSDVATDGPWLPGPSGTVAIDALVVGDGGLGVVAGVSGVVVGAGGFAAGVKHDCGVPGPVYGRVIAEPSYVKV